MEEISPQEVESISAQSSAVPFTGVGSIPHEVVPHQEASGVRQEKYKTKSWNRQRPERIQGTNTNNGSLAIRKRLPYRLEEESFIEHCSEDDRQLLCFELNCALQHFLEQERAVFLEGLGIIAPRSESAQKTHLFDRWGLLREETYRTLEFEKCEDLVALPRGRFPRLAETRDLVARISPRLPVSWHVRWSEKDIRTLIRSYLLFIRNQVVRSGVSHELRSLGTLFALHNRQGNSLSDWYAGADILLQPRALPTTSISSTTLFERPILDSAWELMEAALGSPIHTFSVDIRSTLEPLGGIPLEMAHLPEGDDGYVMSVGVFFRGVGKPSNSTKGNSSGSLVYCTSGLQNFSTAKNKLGTELVFQIPVARLPKSGAEIPTWPLQALAMGWILLQSTRTKTLKPGAGMSAESSLDGSDSSKIRSVVSTALDFLPAENLTSRGPFCFINILGITDDEAIMVRGARRSYLLSLLRLKGIDQVTLVGRNSVLLKTQID